MRTHDQQSSLITLAFHHALGDILGGTTFETLVERDRRTAFRPTAARPCDGCGDLDPALDLWAEHSETGEQLWLCLACGE